MIEKCQEGRKRTASESESGNFESCAVPVETKRLKQTVSEDDAQDRSAGKPEDCRTERTNEDDGDIDDGNKRHYF